MQCTHERILGYLHAPFWICMHGFGSGMQGSRVLCMFLDLVCMVLGFYAWFLMLMPSTIHWQAFVCTPHHIAGSRQRISTQSPCGYRRHRLLVD